MTLLFLSRESILGSHQHLLPNFFSMIKNQFTVGI